jgi:hypothetical protein
LYCTVATSSVFGLGVNRLVKNLVVQTPQLNIAYGACLLPSAAFFPPQLSSCLGLPFSGIATVSCAFCRPHLPKTSERRNILPCLSEIELCFSPVHFLSATFADRQLNIPYGACLLPFPAFFPAQLSSCLGLPFSGTTSLVILLLEHLYCTVATRLLSHFFVASE